MNDNQEMMELEEKHSSGAFGSIKAFEDACRMAKALCASPLVPKEYQGERNLGSAIIALELAQRMNASPLMVMQNLDVIHGRPSWRAQMAIAAINASGRFSPIRYEMSEEGEPETVEYWVVEWKNDQKHRNKKSATIRNRSCRAYAFDRKGERLEGALVDMRMAIREGWYGKTDSKWRSIPELMLRYRAAAWWQRQYAPEILMGMPFADEMRDVIDVTPEKMEVEIGTQSRISSVAEKLAANGNQPESQWPKQVTDHETGEIHWQDSRGIAHNQTIHGMTANGAPAVTKAGHFTRRRGCDKKDHARIEKEALAELNGHQDTQQNNEEQPEGQSEETAQTGAQEARAPTYPEVMHAIQNARDEDAMAVAEDLLNSFDGPDSHREELAEAIESIQRIPRGVSSEQ